MCGRYALDLIPDLLQEEFGIDRMEFTPQPRFNIAPSQPSPIVIGSELYGSGDGCRTGRHERVLRPALWGLIPHWAKDSKIGYKMINARAETLAEKPSYRGPFKYRRCIVPATGFYEWRREGGPTSKVKTPHLIRGVGKRPLALAGLWDHWMAPDGSEVDTYTIITTEPNEMMRRIHNRMPVIMGPEAISQWLDPSLKNPRDMAGLQDLLKPCPYDWLEAFPVSSMVNSSENDGPRCLDPVQLELL